MVESAPKGFLSLMCSALLACLFLLVSGGILARPVSAQEPFKTELTTTYVVDTSGTTKITHTFVVTNTTPTTFLRQYALKLHTTNIENIVVKNANKELQPEIDKQATLTSINITFPDQIVGEGKRREFSILYESKDVADISGKVLEVHIPPFADSEEYARHTVILKTPIQFGKAARSTPIPTNVTIDTSGLVTTFEQPAKTAISAFFGEEQYYKVTLRYRLENKTSSTGLAQIALPPDTSFQRVHIFSLDPPTNDIKIDTDGNWIATYTLPSQSNQDVYLTAAIKVTLEPSSYIPITQPQA
ncbi:hypothetical protein KA082_02840, partial [Candidatus Woesebacteria bacterium]|nr:hypothetical protein [Candidatus Woesebacteria bacterium]